MIYSAYTLSRSFPTLVAIKSCTPTPDVSVMRWQSPSTNTNQDSKILQEQLSCWVEEEGLQWRSVRSQGTRCGISLRVQLKPRMQKEVEKQQQQALSDLAGSHNKADRLEAQYLLRQGTWLHLQQCV